MNTYKPTRLYVKKHTVTGLRYFGKSIREDIYEYNGSGTYWKNHIKKHSKEHIITEWVSDWFKTLEEIKEFALAFSEIFDIVNSNEWANLKDEDGLAGGAMGEVSQKNAAKAISKTKSSLEWKATTGEKSRKKMLKTKNDPEWKATIGKEQARKLSNNQNDPEWKATIGKEQARKNSETRNDLNWKATTGKKRSEKMSKTMSNPTWKLLNSKTCENCNKIISSANYKRWHGVKCKQEKN